MTRMYEVNPTNTSLIYATDFQGQRYAEGAPPGGGSWITHTGPQPSRLGPNAAPEMNIYLAIEDNFGCDAYMDRSVTLTFEGEVQGPTGRVRETAVCTQIPIDDLRARKYQELSNHALSVLYNTAETTLNPNWVLVIDEVMRIWHGSVSEFLQDRMRDRVYDADPKDYWARDVPISIVNKNTDERQQFSVNEAQWGTIKKDIGLHDLSATDARELVVADIEAAHGAGDWTALAGIDVKEPAYGWPPSYPLPTQG